MPIFKISGTKLKKLNSLPLDKERSLQAASELEYVVGLIEQSYHNVI
jgi:hypothetical protein